MKVTTADVTDPGCPKLFNVLIDGEVIPDRNGRKGRHSRGRVLKMGRVWLPILDGAYPLGHFQKRSDCAHAVANYWTALQDR